MYWMIHLLSVLKEQYTNFYNNHLKNVDMDILKLKKEYDKYDKSQYFSPRIRI